MKTRFTMLAYLTALFCAVLHSHAQGFVNLDFESANVSGYSPGGIPTTNAFPGWSASYTQPPFGSSPAALVAYDGISIGGAIISISDIGTGLGFVPPQGEFTAVLFGGSFQTSSTISQTGLVPSGTMSLQALMSFGAFGNIAPVISVGGQTVNMVHLQSFQGYGLFGGDISSFAGQIVTLSFTEPPPVGTTPPSRLILDDIMFSPQAVPEPEVFGLFGLGSLLLGWRFVRCSR